MPCPCFCEPQVAHRRQDIREHISMRQTDIALRLAMEQGRRVREEEVGQDMGRVLGFRVVRVLGYSYMYTYMYLVQ